MEFYRTLPFANGKFESTPIINEPIAFNLEKDARLVTLFPINDHTQVPPLLIDYIHAEHTFVVEEGLTYPYHEPFDRVHFVENWFTHFVAVLLEGEHQSLAPHMSEPIGFWEEKFLGTFYVRPNFPGRCSHICNGGFIVNHKKRGLGLGKEMGRKYLVWAPQLGYAYSMFNLVFETNVASLNIWDLLGFERIGYVKKAAVLKGHSEFVPAVQFGKDLI